MKGKVGNITASNICQKSLRNITNLTRNNQSGTAMDNLTYQYATDVNGNILNNRLLHVNDAVVNNATTTDIRNQGNYEQQRPSTHNYAYDEVGNLIKDKSEDIAEIKWTVTGKVSDVIRANGSSKPDLHFDYDAMGQRIAKTVTNKNVTTGDKFVTTYYVRDPQGNVLAVYEHMHGDSDNGTFTLAEQHLYGASRLGMRKRDLALNATNTNETPATYYELTNHLGNVMAVISDEASTTDEPMVVSLSDYYPYGMTMGGRSYSADEYRYGFQGQDKEKELWGGEASFFTYRISDNRLGKFFSVDPLSSKFPWNSSYAFSENRVIDGVEMEGLEYLDVNNPYIEKGAVENVNGQTNLTLGSTKFEGVQIENIGGVDYYNLGKHMYINDENCWSETGSRYQQQTDETKVGIMVINNTLKYSVFQRGKLDERDVYPFYATSVDTTVKNAVKYINSGGICHVVTMTRINEAYGIGADGKYVLSTANGDEDLLISGLANKKRTNFEYGVALALQKKGLAGDLLNTDDIWAGKLQIGAPIQSWTGKGGHSRIFWMYEYNTAGEIIGFHFIDSHGIDGNKNNAPTEDSKMEKGFSFYGANLKDK